MIIGKTFSKRLRGIDPDEVDFFLREVAEYVGKLVKENNQLQQKIIELDTRVKERHALEDPAERTMRNAEESVHLAIENAEKEAKHILEEAERKAAELLEKSRNDLSLLKESIIIMQAKRESIGARLKMLLQSELDLVRSLETEDAKESQEQRVSPNQSSDAAELEDIIKSLDSQS